MREYGPEAYWINPYGKIMDVSMKHINMINDNPEEFGLTKDYIKSIYDKYGEPYGLEGKAREEIMMELIKKGWIRIRFAKNRWVIQLWKLTNSSENYIFNWVSNIIEKYPLNKNNTVVVNSISNNDIKQVSCEDILAGRLVEHKKIKLMEVLMSILKRVSNG